MPVKVQCKRKAEVHYLNKDEQDTQDESTRQWKRKRGKYIVSIR